MTKHWVVWLISVGVLAANIYMYFAIEAKIA